jgi:hypothetical protein
LRILKIGEDPPFGIMANDELSRFLTNDAELFAKGLRAENQGLGIGAYTYYRRIVDNQKDHLLDQIEKVLKLHGGSTEISAAIAKARSTDSFTRAMEQIKGMLPGSLRVDGHNPLQLIYDQLSDGVHGQSDEVCLARAAIIREALSGMAGRIAALLKEDETLRQAISTLTNLQSKSAGPGAA